MASKIHILTEDVVNKIAAGEVVERPASTVKELVENSIDARSSSISVRVLRGGKKMIEVSDDGEGMTRDDAILGLKRHATSKISDIEDISKISTLGFRGEALSSIASVSRLNLITRTDNDKAGSKIRISGGRQEEVLEVGCPRGTTVRADDLFFNLPARRKFLKTDFTETSHIIKIIQRLALATPRVSFHLKEDGKDIVGPLPKNQPLKQRIASLFGTNIADGLLEIDFENRLLSINGFITKPEVNFSNKNYQFFFMNNRPIESPLIRRAIMEGYKTLLMNNRHPGVFLFVECLPELVDINVHPAKREVRFSNERGLYTILEQVIRSALRDERVIPEVKDKGTISYSVSRKNYTDARKIREAMEKAYPEIDLFKKEEFKAHRRPVLEPMQELDTATERAESASGPFSFFQVSNQYVLREYEDGIIIYDQHACSERVNYERLKDAYRRAKVESQSLLFPLTVDFPIDRAEALKKNLKLLERLGFVIEEFGKATFVIKQYPVITGREIETDLLRAIVEDITDGMKPLSRISYEELAETIIKTIACRTAIKFGDSLQIEEMKTLIRNLSDCDTPYTCPHGRPTMIKISKKELDKRFKRTK